MARKKRGPETARIERATHDGRGIAAVEGKKVFVAGALPGEEVRFQRRKRRRNYDEAELLEVLEPSPSRIEPRCAVYEQCGGCALQHLDVTEQRQLKEQTLRDNMSRIGDVEPEEWLAPLYEPGEDGSWFYRRRARLAVKDVAAKGRVLVGFREKHSPFVTNMHRCEILAKPLDGLIDALSELVGSLTIRARLPQIEVAVADNATALVFRVLDPPTDADLEHLRNFGNEHDLRILLQSKGPDSVEALEADLPPLHYRLDEFDVRLEFEGTDFVQVNGRVNQRMVSTALTLLEATDSDTVLDLYCGIGNFSLPLARTAGKVIGIEGEERQVVRARHNAAINGIGNVEFVAADLSQIDGNEPWLRNGCDRLLLDPARSGADAVARQVRKLGPARIVYVSCHPGTLARDAGELVHQQGYSLAAAGIIDMFPHTGHVESIAVFNKNVKK